MSPSPSRPWPFSSPSPPPDREALIAAWQAWDARPGDKGTANRFVDRCADYLGGPTNEFRHFLAAARRDGLTYAAAVTEWEILHET